MTTHTADLVEYFAQGYALKEAHVNRDSGVISNVALLGAVSANNRRYSPQALNDAVRLYKGARMFLDHPSDRELRERRGTRSLRDMCGKVLSARLVGSQVRGDVQIVGPHKDMIFDIAESMPELIGHSHRAKGKVKPDGSGGMVVESLESVQAVELVSEPATTNGLFESTQHTTHGDDPMDLNTITEEQLRAERPDLIEAIRSKAKGSSDEHAALKLENYKLRKVNEANLPAKVKTKAFVDTLEAADSEKKVDILIADRRDLAERVLRLRGSLTATLDESKIGDYADQLFGLKQTSIDESRIGEYDKQLFG